MIFQGMGSEYYTRRSFTIKIRRPRKNIRKFNIKTIIYPCDVSKKSEVEQMGREILDKCGHVDILVNNAGFGLYGKVQNQSIEQIESVTFTNYLGVVY